MTRVPAALRARLVHDVGKHVARIARNVRGGRVEAPLVPLLIKDLYRTDGTRHASRVLADLCTSIEARQDARLARAASLLHDIDALEDAVTRADEEALGRVVALALEVESELRSLAAAPEEP